MSGDQLVVRKGIRFGLSDWDGKVRIFNILAKLVFVGEKRAEPRLSSFITKLLQNKKPRVSLRMTPTL